MSYKHCTLDIIKLLQYGIACVIVLSLIPQCSTADVCPNSSSVEAAQIAALTAKRNSLVFFNATYLLPAGYRRRRGVPVTTSPQCQQNPTGGTGASTTNTQCTGQTSTVASTGRRRRNVLCDRTFRSGDAIEFSFQCICPNCSQSQAALQYQITLYARIHELFNLTLRINVTADDGTNLPLELCKVQNLNCTVNCTIPITTIKPVPITTAITTTTTTTTTTTKTTTTTTRSTTTTTLSTCNACIVNTNSGSLSCSDACGTSYGYNTTFHFPGSSYRCSNSVLAATLCYFRAAAAAAITNNRYDGCLSNGSLLPCANGRGYCCCVPVHP